VHRKRLLAGILAGIATAAGAFAVYQRQSGLERPTWLQRDWIEVTVLTGCQPIPVPNYPCQDALSFDEVLQLRGTLDMCSPHSWSQMNNITDRGVGFEAEASRIDSESLECLDRFITKKAAIRKVLR